MSKDLYYAAVFFATETTSKSLKPRSGFPTNVCHILGRRSATKNLLRNFAHPSQSPFRRSDIKIKQRIWKFRRTLYTGTELI